MSHHHRLYRSSSSSNPFIHGYHDEGEDVDTIPGDQISIKSVIPQPKSPPRHRHDGTSPLPLGMDWSLPPRKWV